MAWQADFDEGLTIDYRHFDAAGIEPLYAFGYGMAYTDFSLIHTLRLETQFPNGTLAARPQAQRESSPGGNPELWEPVLQIAAEVANTGTRAGAAVPQLYVSFPPDSMPKGTPSRVLRGFEKMWLEPGEKRKITFEMARRDVSYWDSGLQDWVVPSGAFTFYVGFSSREIVASTVISLR
ncbi:hypothetical protein BU23DRAFT_295634 [Bimuria novae-zelandiae CBS 107.79]|uniref:beta-glucosidase n=1 Tax=Bimuria novae-zelandiae CBS 107.79 TaxID=1447943 RepID=A0A6A5VK97_9PLEO|nr:hypothetical protein BU23DRAFT_295634 [Bimuria novae-zelandiae CBS 107.79]